MLRDFESLVNEVVDEAFQNGVKLFMESLEEDLEKEALFEEHGGVDQFLSAVFESINENQNQTEDDDLENIDESKVDAILSELEKEGLI